MHLWQRIVEQPEAMADAYEAIWMQQFGNEREYYDTIRHRFNRTRDPDAFLFLLTRCVKASVRYNARGEFNQSPDNRRKGTRPATIRNHVYAASRLLSGHCTLRDNDYRLALQDATPSDIVYLDPPYQGVCGNRDPRYSHSLLFHDFATNLDTLNTKSISYILSYDGRTGGKAFGEPMPTALGLTHLELDMGRSSQATLLGRVDVTYESLYLSPALTERMGKYRNATKPADRTASRFLFEFGE